MPVQPKVVHGIWGDMETIAEWERSGVGQIKLTGIEVTRYGVSCVYFSRWTNKHYTVCRERGDDGKF